MRSDLGLIVLAHIRQRAHLAARHARHANLAAVADEVDMQGILAVGRNELTKDLVSFFIGRVFGDPAESLGHTKDMGIDRECR